MNSNSLIGGAIIVAIVLVFVGPLLVIWGLNTLFPVLAIPYTFETWAAILLVRLVFQTNVSLQK